MGSPQKSDVVHMEASKEQQQRPVLCPSPPPPPSVGLFQALPGLHPAQVMFWGMLVQGDAITPSPYQVQRH